MGHVLGDASKIFGAGGTINNPQREPKIYWEGGRAIHSCFLICFSKLGIDQVGGGMKCCPVQRKPRPQAGNTYSHPPLANLLSRVGSGIPARSRPVRRPDFEHKMQRPSSPGGPSQTIKQVASVSFFPGPDHPVLGYICKFSALRVPDKKPVYRFL